MARPAKASAAALRGGWRSGLEGTVAKYLEGHGLDPEYETEKIPYVKPETNHKYTPDFIIRTLNSGKKIYIETKGIFDLDDRKKHLLIREQHPLLDIRFVFTNPNSRIRKGSPTTYAKWCEKNGFLYAKKLPPKEWLYE